MTPRRDLISAVVMVIDGAFEQRLNYTRTMRHGPGFPRLWSRVWDGPARGKEQALSTQKVIDAARFIADGSFRGCTVLAISPTSKLTWFDPQLSS